MRAADAAFAGGVAVAAVVADTAAPCALLVCLVTLAATGAREAKNALWASKSLCMVWGLLLCERCAHE